MKIGAGDLANLCERIEHAGRNGDWNVVGASMKVFDREIERVDSYIATLPAVQVT